MPLQNRAAPDGSLQAEPARGLFTGNRGLIHDPDTRSLTGRRWTTQSWIVCTLDWRGRRRDVWGRNRPGGRTGWSELFFLDEVTALAAGHRPCFYCRRNAATDFMIAFDAANKLEAGPVGERDRILHAQRWQSRRSDVPWLAGNALASLPDGAVVEAQGQFFALKGDAALPWTFSGYGAALPRSDRSLAKSRLVTPPAICAALSAGYRPVWHPSAGH